MFVLAFLLHLFLRHSILILQWLANVVVFPFNFSDYLKWLIFFLLHLSSIKQGIWRTKNIIFLSLLLLFAKVGLHWGTCGFFRAITTLMLSTLTKKGSSHKHAFLFLEREVWSKKYINAFFQANLFFSLC